MKHHFAMIGFAAAVTLLAADVSAKTKAAFFFDTEDYTCDRSNDAIRDIANILKSEGVKGNFNVVGFLGLRLVELGRFDVIDALRHHVLGTQTLYHSRHPDIAELGDDPSYERAYRRTLADEARGVGMLEAAFGEGRVRFACPPGNSVSAVAIEAYSDLGIAVNAATGFYGDAAAYSNVTYSTGLLVRKGKTVGGLWYFNQYHLPYYTSFTLEGLLPRPGKACPDFKTLLDRLAKFDYAGLYMHPHMALKTNHWDGRNYRYGNNCKWREWLQEPDRDPLDTAVFYERLRAFIRAMKADERFVITDVDQLLAETKPRQAITRAEIPLIRAALAKAFGPIREPASWSVADCFQAAVRLLRGETAYKPGKVRGFLSRPRGVSADTEVSADALKEAAKAMDLEAFLPPEIAVGGKSIGPADFLFATLEVLETGADKVTVSPREQLGSFSEVPSIEKMNISNSWVHTKEFKDRYLSERLRLQLWTMRFEY